MSLISDYPIISPEELYQFLEDGRVRILDATIPKVGGILPPEEIRNLRIKGALYFDLKRKFIDLSNPLPNTMPTKEIFDRGCSELEITNESVVVLYDQHGVYSSPRAWWMFKAMGHKEVYVLNGGLPGWMEMDYPVETVKKTIVKEVDYHANMTSQMICDKSFIDIIRNDKNFLILDARSKGRFTGMEPEARKELRSGHIPNSRNLPYSIVVGDGKYLSREDLIKIYDNVNPDKKSLVFTCGSGITACVIGLGAVAAGHGLGKVYDGSWSDWGMPSELPVEIGEG